MPQARANMQRNALDAAMRLCSDPRVRRAAPWRHVVAPAGKALLAAANRALPYPMRTPYGTLFYRRDERDLYTLALRLGRYEPGTSQVFRSLLDGAAGVVDVGAHIGYYALMAAHLLGAGGTVYAFEADPSTYRLLRSNVLANGYASVIRTFPIGVSHAPGSAVLYRSRDNSRVNSVYLGPAARSAPITVPLAPLDTVFGDLGWPRVDVVKMDIEGSEVAALAGMRQLALCNPGLRLIIEFAPESLASAGTRPEELLEAVGALGLQTVYAIDGRSGALEPLDDAMGAGRLVERTLGGGIDLLCTR